MIPWDENSLRDRFSRSIRAADHFDLLLKELRKSEWESQSTREAVLNGLEDIDRKFIGSRHVTTESILTKLFGESIRQTYPLIKGNKSGLPADMRVLLVDEYLKLFSFAPVVRNYNGKRRLAWNPVFFSKWEDLLTRATTVDVQSLINDITAARDVIIGKARGRSRGINGTDLARSYRSVCRVLKDDFFETWIKRLIVNQFVPQFDFTEGRLSAIRKIEIGDFTSEVHKKVFLSFKGFPRNREYVEFRRNLFFSYFFVLLDYAKYKHEKLTFKYSKRVLRSTIDLNSHFPSLSDRPFVKGLDEPKVGSIIKDFYNANSA